MASDCLLVIDLKGNVFLYFIHIDICLLAKRKQSRNDKESPNFAQAIKKEDAWSTTQCATKMRFLFLYVYKMY